MTIEIKNVLEQIVLTGHADSLTNFANMILDKVRLKHQLSATFVEKDSKPIVINLLYINPELSEVNLELNDTGQSLYKEKSDMIAVIPRSDNPTPKTPKYEIAFDFTKDNQIDLREKIWPETLAKRIIKAEFGLDPCTDNKNGDVRYSTEDPVLFIELLKILQYASGGGNWSVEPMPQGYHVFHRGTRGAKYNNCPDFPSYVELMTNYLKKLS